MMGLNKYVLLGGGAAAAVMLAVIGLMHLQIGRLENKLESEKQVVKLRTEERDEAMRIANANADELAIVQDERNRTMAVLDAARAEDAEREETIKELVKEVHSAKPAECPAGDALAAAHRGLRSLATGKDGH